MKNICHNSFLPHYAFANKVGEQEEHGNILEAFRDNVQIFLWNKKCVFTQEDFIAQAEMLTYIPLCLHSHAQNVVVFTDKNPYILQQFSQNHIQPYHVCFAPSIYSFICDSLQKPYSTNLIQNVATLANKLQDKKIDILIADAGMPKNIFEDIKPYLSATSILIAQNISFVHSFAEAKKQIQFFADHFRIVMPFFIPYLNNMESHFIFASCAFHPLADLELQKADMLEDVYFYSAHMHQSCFVLPKWLSKKLRGVAKN